MTARRHSLQDQDITALEYSANVGTPALTPRPPRVPDAIRLDEPTAKLQRSRFVETPAWRDMTMEHLSAVCPRHLFVRAGLQSQD